METQLPAKRNAVPSNPLTAPVTLSALVLHMVAAYVCGTAVYISGVRVMQSLLTL